MWVSPAADPDDFVLVTERSISRLRALQFNAVLQAARPTVDGSLSVYCQGRALYVSVGAEFGHGAEQVRMLEAVRVLAITGARRAALFSATEVNIGGASRRPPVAPQRVRTEDRARQARARKR